VEPMKVVPKKVVSFANDLYPSVRAEKELIQIFLKEGRPTQKLTEAEQELDEKENIQMPRWTNESGDEVFGVLLHGCSGVFTDEKGIVYFWRLSSPRILFITSQKYETTHLILEKAHLDLITGLRGVTKKKSGKK
jgi:hypothetical protein